MLALLGERDVTHVAVAFDHVIESFRNDLFPATRPATASTPRCTAQFGLAEDAMPRARDRHVADDRVRVRRRARDGGRALRRRAGASSRVVDLLAGQGPRAVRARRRASCAWTACGASGSTSAASIEKFGVDPESIPDWLALVGDTRRRLSRHPALGREVGGRRARASTRRLEAIPTDAAAWRSTVRGAAALAASFAAHRDRRVLVPAARDAAHGRAARRVARRLALARSRCAGADRARAALGRRRDRRARDAVRARASARRRAASRRARQACRA